MFQMFSMFEMFHGDRGTNRTQRTKGTSNTYPYTLNEFYRNEEILEALFLQLKDREAWVQWGNEPGPRPCEVKDLDELRELIFRRADAGVVKVYHSVEVFSDVSKLTECEPRELRKDWDYVIDIDSEDLDGARKLASALVEALELYGITPKIKFSGRRGFHIIVTGRAFDIFTQEDYVKAYEILPQQITKFLLEVVRSEIRDLAKVDFAIYTPRRLLRCAYSLHDSGLVSIPVYDVMRFKLEDAKPENVKEIDLGWICYENQFREGKKLLDALMTWLQDHKKPDKTFPRGKGEGEGRDGEGERNQIKWIERLMENPVDDGRHRLLWLVIAPYLVNVKKLSLDEAYEEAKRYFEECDRVKRLRGRFDHRIRYYLQYAARKNLRPLSLRSLREKPEYQDLWRIVDKALEGRT